jgi:hypothetical protein
MDGTVEYHVKQSEPGSKNQRSHVFPHIWTYMLNVYIHTYMIIYVHIYIYKYNERENKIVLVSLSERTRRGRGGKENVRE